jgi:hypothetical protein
MADQIERRKSARHRVLKSGRIVFNEGRSTIDCMVRSESLEGARLKVATILGISDQFELSIMSAPPKACRIIWRSAVEIGIAYETT